MGIVFTDSFENYTPNSFRRQSSTGWGVANIGAVWTAPLDTVCDYCGQEYLINLHGNSPAGTCPDCYVGEASYELLVSRPDSIAWVSEDPRMW